MSVRSSNPSTVRHCTGSKISETWRESWDALESFTAASLRGLADAGTGPLGPSTPAELLPHGRWETGRMMDLDLERLGADLPFAQAVPRLRAALAGHGVAVVEAPPGTGKTTLAPPAAALELGADARSRVVVVQPRRVAARAAAQRLSQLSGTRLGELSGLTVRGQREVGPGTAIEFVTPGVLIGRLLADPELSGTRAIVLDEVHERGLEIDLLLGMVLELRQLREDLALIVMSATLDAGSFRDLIGQALGLDEVPLVDSRAVEHPLEVRWAPGTGPRLDERGVRREFLDHGPARRIGSTSAAWPRTLASTPSSSCPEPGRSPTWLLGSGSSRRPRCSSCMGASPRTSRTSRWPGASRTAAPGSLSPRPWPSPR